MGSLAKGFSRVLGLFLGKMTVRKKYRTFLPSASARTWPFQLRPWEGSPWANLRDTPAKKERTLANLFLYFLLSCQELVSKDWMIHVTFEQRLLNPEYRLKISVSSEKFHKAPDDFMLKSE